MKAISVYVALAVAVVAIAAASYFGVMNSQCKVRLKLISQDAIYLKDNISYRVAPRDIKQKIDNIVKASECKAKAVKCPIVKAAAPEAAKK